METIELMSKKKTKHATGKAGEFPLGAYIYFYMCYEIEDASLKSKTFAKVNPKHISRLGV